MHARGPVIFTSVLDVLRRKAEGQHSALRGFGEGVGPRFGESLPPGRGHLATGQLSTAISPGRRHPGRVHAAEPWTPWFLYGAVAPPVFGVETFLCTSTTRWNSHGMKPVKTRPAVASYLHRCVCVTPT